MSIATHHRRGRRTAQHQVPAIAGIVRAVWVGPMLLAGKLYQDAAKTTPADADEEPVRAASDPFGLGLADATAPDDNHRPKLNDEGGGKWSLYGTAAEKRHLEFAQYYSAAGAYSLFGAYRHNDLDNVLVLAGYYGASAVFVGWWTDRSFRVIDQDTNVVASQSATAPTVGSHVYEAHKTAAGAWSLRIDNGDPIALTAGVGSNAAVYFTAFGAGFVDVVNATTNRMAAACVFDGEPTDAERATLYAFLAGLV